MKHNEDTTMSDQPDQMPDGMPDRGKCNENATMRDPDGMPRQGEQRPRPTDPNAKQMQYRTGRKTQRKRNDGRRVNSPPPFLA